MSPAPPDRPGPRRSSVAQRLSEMLSEIESDRRPAGSAASSTGDPDPVFGPAAATGSSLFDQDTAGTAENPAVPDAAKLAAAAMDLGPKSAEMSGPDVATGDGARSRSRSGGGRRDGERHRRPMMALGVVVTLLVLSIPVLGYTGFQRLLRSRGGSIAHHSSDSTQVGFEAVVEPTPTALIIQTDDEGVPESLTVLTLGAGDGGGTVVFVPIDTLLDRPVFYWNRLRLTAESGDLGVVAVATARLLRIGFTETIVVNHDKWAELVGPVSPLSFENPDDVEAEDNLYPVGGIELPPEEVGPYLLARTSNQESDLNRLNRQELFWRAWIDAVSASPREDPVPGETDTGIGRFIRTMARGEVEYETLPVTPLDEPADDGHTVFLPDVIAIRDLMTAAVPFPIAASPEDRFLVKVLNGVRGEFLPTSVTDPIVAAGAQVTTIGNASKFGHKTTIIEYHDEADKKSAEAVRYALGTGKLVLDPASDDTVALTVTIGRDVLGESGEGPTTTSEGPSTSKGTSSTEITVDNDDGVGGNGD